jgi:hypothetical protein
MLTWLSEIRFRELGQCWDPVGLRATRRKVCCGVHGRAETRGLILGNAAHVQTRLPDSCRGMEADFTGGIRWIFLRVADHALRDGLYRPHTIISCGKRSRMCMVRFLSLFRIVAPAQGPIRRHPVLDACRRARNPAARCTKTAQCSLRGEQNVTQSDYPA